MSMMPGRRCRPPASVGVGGGGGGGWKKLCLDLAVDFGGFDLSERLSHQCLKCPELARKVGLDEVEEDDVDSLLESITEELSMEELDELEKQRCQLEEEVEAEQHPTAPPMKKMTVKILQGVFGLLNQVLDYMEEMDPDYEQAGLTRCRMLAGASHYEQLLYEKRREAMQSTLNSIFKREASLPEASASNEPLTSDEPQQGTSTGGYTLPNVSLPLPSSSSDIDDPDVI